jgi:hypothetical protein
MYVCGICEINRAESKASIHSTSRTTTICFKIMSFTSAVASLVMVVGQVHSTYCPPKDILFNIKCPGKPV